MRRDINVRGLGCSAGSATIVIDKDGMRVENKDPSYQSDSFFTNSFLCDCLDMDEWKESWYIDTGKMSWKGSDARKRARAVYDKKIAHREEQIEALRQAKQVLSKS